MLWLGPISPFYLLFVSFGSGALGLLILFWGMQYVWEAVAKPKWSWMGRLRLISAS